VFGICGGCKHQNVPGALQLRDKQSRLVAQLSEAGGIEPDSYDLLPALTGPRWNYRRKARLAVRLVRRKGRVLVGFREKRGRLVTVMDNCEVLAPPLAQLIRPLAVLIVELDARAAIPQIEVAAGESAAHPPRPEAALVLRHLRPLTSADLSRLRRFAVQWGLQMYLQPGGVDSVRRLHPRAGGENGGNGESGERLYYHLPGFDLRLGFHPMDFLQVNAAVNRRMVDLIIQLLAPLASDRVLDLFCGLGNFSLPLARRCRAVTGIEASAGMVGRARENAAANGLGNASFVAADLYRKDASLPGLPLPIAAYDKILLDPPRSGAMETIPLIAASGARRLVYVSCNPVSLARDARELRRRGYDLKSAGVMDMFPHTSHVESVAMFETAEPITGGPP